VFRQVVLPLPHSFVQLLDDYLSAQSIAFCRLAFEGKSISSFPFPREAMKLGQGGMGNFKEALTG